MNKKIMLFPLLAMLLVSCDLPFASTTPSEGESLSIVDSNGSHETISDISDVTTVTSDEVSETSAISTEISEVPTTSTSTTPSTPPSSTSVSTEPDGLRLVWSDEFDGDTLLAKNWTPMRGDGSDYGIYGWGNSEKQWYTDRTDNVRVENGNLVITAIKEQMRTMEYTSARIRSAGKVSTKYGYIEARIKLPPIVGLWPAFWMLPEYGTPYGGWPNSGEIDIMEARGRVPESTTAALHYGGNPSNNGGASVYKASTYNFKNSSIAEYHTYAISWEEELIEWFVDGNSFFFMRPGPRGGWFSGSSDEYLAPFDQEFHILLNMAVGGHFDGHLLPPNDFTYAEMFVDYVRIYEFV